MKTLASGMRVSSSGMSAMTTNAIGGLDDLLSRLSGSGVESPSAAVYTGETSGVYTGAYETVVIAAADTPTLINTDTASIGDTVGVTDNNDCSFTNPFEYNIELFGFIGIGGGNASDKSFNVMVGTDNSGSVLPLDLGTGSLISKEGDGLQHFATYSIVLLPSKSVMPLVQNFSDGSDFTIKSIQHRVYGRRAP